MPRPADPYRSLIIDTLPPDPLLCLVAHDIQRAAARSAADAFARSFALTLDSAPAARQAGIGELAARLADWCQVPGREAQATRLALLLAALDQWGLVWSQTFGVDATVGLTELVGALRNPLDPAAEAACQAAYTQLQAAEAHGFTFKAETARAIHLALWHSLIAETQRDTALHLAEALGGLLLSTHTRLPQTGWLIVAGSLADLRIRSQTHQLANEGLALEMTQQVQTALAQALPPADRQRLFAAVAQAVAAWQQQRGDSPAAGEAVH